MRDVTLEGCLKADKLCLMNTLPSPVCPWAGRAGALRHANESDWLTTPSRSVVPQQWPADRLHERRILGAFSAARSVAAAAVARAQQA